MAKGEYAPVNWLKRYHEVHGEGDDLPPEAVAVAIGGLLGAGSRP